MEPQQGGCLCGAVRYEICKAPHWVTVCLCTFCQRATGSQGMIQPVFDVVDFAITKGAPKRYTHISKGSGKEVGVHFCDACGTKTHLTFERWPDKMGVYSGTLDDPNWFDFTPENSKYIFVDEAARGTLVPAGYKSFAKHAASSDGAPIEPTVLSQALHIR